MRIAIICLTASWILACVGTVQENVEEGQFLLDKGQYSAALDKANAALAIDPTDIEARLLKAEALIALVVVGNGGSILALFADFQEAETGDETTHPFRTFARIAPSDSSQQSDLEDATNTLIDLTGEPAVIASEGKRKSVYLKLYLARLFEIANAIRKSGAASDDDQCNIAPFTPNPDGVPDGLNPAALSSADNTRLQDNLDNVNADGASAGLPSSFELSDRILAISTELTLAINGAGSVDQGTIDFFEEQFGLTGLAVCP